MKLTMPFALHPRLAQDTVEVARLHLCQVLVMKDRRFPWLILVPERESVREIHELAPEDRAALVEEIARAGEALLSRPFRPQGLGTIFSQGIGLRPQPWAGVSRPVGPVERIGSACATTGSSTRGSPPGSAGVAVEV
jgi:HIT domain-containing protein